MTVGIRDNEPDDKLKYGDIIDLPHWEPSKKHPRMSLIDRAAQFAPFAALSGYDEMVEEEARVVDQKIELGDEDKEMINRKLNVLSAAENPIVTITYFVPDLLKVGGSYETVTETIKRIDPVHRKVILRKKVGIAGTNMEIDMDDILEIRSDMLDDFDEEVF